MVNKNYKILNKSLNIYKLPKQKEKNFFYNIKKSKTLFFILKLFKSTIKNGKKIKAFNNFINIFLYLLAKKRMPFFKFFNLIFKRLNLELDYKTQNLGRTKYKLPYIADNKKSTTRPIRWILKSTQMRYENNYSLRLTHELIEIFFNSGNTIEKKKEYFMNFFRDRSFVRFLKFYRPRYRFRPNFLKFIKIRRKKIKIKKKPREVKFKRGNAYLSTGEKFAPRIKIKKL